MADWQDPNYRFLRNVLRRLAEQPRLRTELKAEETAAQAQAELMITSADARQAILNVLNVIESQPGLTTSASTTDNHAGRAQTRTPDGVETKSDVSNARTFFEEAFGQLRRAYRVSLWMSSTMFFVGLVFLGLAAGQAILRPGNVGMVSVVGGIGIVQIVALFYRNPLADIARAVAVAQQAKIAITSYLLGVTLVRDSIGLEEKPTDQHLKNLLQLTDRTLSQLQICAGTSLPLPVAHSPTQRSDAPPLTERTTQLLDN